MDEVEQAWDLRRKLGRDLKAQRKAAGLTQPQLARRTGYSRSTVATLESANGGAVARGFWERCDTIFGTGEKYAHRWDEIHQHVQAARTLSAAVRRRPGPRRVVTAGPTHLQALRILRSAAPGPEGIAQARDACAQLGWPTTDDTEHPELRTGAAIDALQVPHAAGTLAISWWLDTGGTADPIRRLPAILRPDQALAAISATGSIYFLAKAGTYPWPSAESSPHVAAGVTPARPIIAWHSHNSRLPLPPGRAADGNPAQWAHLPSRGVSLTSPVALLELLAKAISAIERQPRALTLPGGILAVPALHS